MEELDTVFAKLRQSLNKSEISKRKKNFIFKLMHYLILIKKYFLNHQIVKICNPFFILLVNQEDLKTGH